MQILLTVMAYPDGELCQSLTKNDRNSGFIEIKNYIEKTACSLRNFDVCQRRQNKFRKCICMEYIR